MKVSSSGCLEKSDLVNEIMAAQTNKFVSASAWDGMDRILQRQIIKRHNLPVLDMSEAKDVMQFNRQWFSMDLIPKDVLRLIIKLVHESDLPALAMTSKLYRQLIVEVNRTHKLEEMKQKKLKKKMDNDKKRKIANDIKEGKIRLDVDRRMKEIDEKNRREAKNRRY